ncbi:hypothetical protein WAK64_07240 [Bacillus spongiae]|uniref:Uncharacterized protein n=1 Tax=Bacillus spongiae TaxID=2683610 RepID=A0ABU8HCG5_9BACI
MTIKKIIYICAVLVILTGFGTIGYSTYAIEISNQEAIQECKDKGLYPEYDRGIIFNSSVMCSDIPN